MTLSWSTTIQSLALSFNTLQTLKPVRPYSTWSAGHRRRPSTRYVYQPFLRITAKERTDVHPHRTTDIHYYMRRLEAKTYNCGVVSAYRPSTQITVFYYLFKKARKKTLTAIWQVVKHPTPLLTRSLGILELQDLSCWLLLTKLWLTFSFFFWSWPWLPWFFQVLARPVFTIWPILVYPLTFHSSLCFCLRGATVGAHAFA